MPQPRDLPFRIGVFDDLASAERAVQGLLDAGFDAEDVSVICSERGCEEHFPDDVHQEEPAGEKTKKTALTGGIVGATLGGLAAVVGIVTSGGLAIFAAGAALPAAAGGAVAGSFVGAMASRGMEKEIADYYDQAVEEGRILVAAEAGDDREARRRAERVFEDAGAHSVRLPEG